MTNAIKFYDIAFQNHGQCQSPNTWKTRYSLNFKGIPFETVWVEYADIEETCKKIGAPPTGVKVDGSPLYTLPAIHDPSTGTTLAESYLIAKYLDETYPDTPTLIPRGTSALQAAFQDAFMAKLAPLWQFALPKAALTVSPRSEEYIRRTRLPLFGMTMEEMYPKGETKITEWKKVEKAFSDIDKWYGKDEYIMGDILSFADFTVGSFVLWCRILYGEESNEWRDVLSWNGGRFRKLVLALEKYEGGQTFGSTSSTV